MEYKRNCPLCGKDLYYKSNSAWNLSKRRNSKCRNCSTKAYAKRIGDASFLLNETNESFYWIGFILADGSISKSSRLKITLSDKDEKHLYKLSKRLNTKIFNRIATVNNKKYNMVTMSIMHTEIFNKLCLKYDIKGNKTYFPPNVSVFKNLTHDQQLSIFVGFIDGDGSIGLKHKRNDFGIRIKNHGSWVEFLEFFNDVLEFNGNVKINKNGYSIMDVSSYKMCKKIKNQVKNLNIPYLKRKWNKINLDYGV